MRLRKNFALFSIVCISMLILFSLQYCSKILYCTLITLFVFFASFSCISFSKSSSLTVLNRAILYFSLTFVYVFLFMFCFVLFLLPMNDLKRKEKNVTMSSKSKPKQTLVSTWKYNATIDVNSSKHCLRKPGTYRYSLTYSLINICRLTKISIFIWYPFCMGGA